MYKKQCLIFTNYYCNKWLNKTEILFSSCKNGIQNVFKIRYLFKILVVVGDANPKCFLCKFAEFSE